MKKILYWSIAICSIAAGSFLGLVLGIIGTIHIWKAMIEWGL